MSTDTGSVVDRFLARLRAANQNAAAILSSLVELADATPVEEFAAFEIAAAATWSRQSATVQLDLATDIVRRLPAVHAAMARGDLDLPKARVIRDGVATLDLSVARRIVAAILPTAPGLTTGQLRARLAKLVIETDPACAAAQHKARVRGRRVVFQPAEDSCANIFGLDLPADTALAASDRISAIAHAVKRTGDPRSIDQLRADTFLNLLLGNTYATPIGTASPGAASAGAASVGPASAGLCGGASAGRPGGGVELVASLQTLAGLAEQPGHLNGYGPVIADIARQVAAQQSDTPWTFTIYDEATGEIRTGTLRTRPTHAARGGGSGRQRPARTGPGRRSTTRSGSRQGAKASAQGSDTPPGHTSAASAASAARAAPNGSATDGSSTAGAAAGGGAAGAAGSGSAVTAAASGFGDPARRFPNAALARHIRARDRTCRAPGCRRPATHADIDHTIAFHRGGLTVPGNLGLLCRHHHHAKHGGWWRLEQVKPGIFVWRSPLGRRYIVRPCAP